MTSFQDFVFYEPCQCAEVVAVREKQKQVEAQRDKNLIVENQRKISQSIRAMFDEVPDKFQNAGFDNFEQLEHVQKAFKAALRFSQSFPSRKWLMLVGNIGTGKTHLAAAIANSVIAAGQSVIFGTVPTLLERIQDTFGDNQKTVEIMRLFSRCSLLVLDDLGKGKITEWAESKLFDILNSRYERNLDVVITTKYGLDVIQKKYPNVGEDIVSRLFEMCKGISIKGADYRMKKGNL